MAFRQDADLIYIVAPDEAAPGKWVVVALPSAQTAEPPFFVANATREEALRECARLNELGVLAATQGSSEIS